MDFATFVGVIVAVTVALIIALVFAIGRLLRPTPEMLGLPTPAATGDGTDAADPEGPGDDSLVAIARFHFPEQANLLRGRLLADGIPAFVMNAHSTQAFGYLRLAHGGVQVQVPASRAEEAREILQALDAGEFALDEDAENDGDERPSP